MSDRIFRVNGAVYQVPTEKAVEFDRHAKRMAGQYPKVFTIDDDRTGTVKRRHVPASLRSISFSVMLAEWADENWGRFKT